MGTGTFDAAAEAWRNGEMDLGALVKATERERRGWVGRLRRKTQPIPVWLDEDDSSQDLLVDMVQRSRTHDPARASAGDYLRFSVKHAIKRVQKARGVEQHRRTGTPRFERTFTSIGVETIDRPHESSIEAEYLRREYYAILRGLCDTKAQLAVVCALEASGGSLDAAAAHLYANTDARLACRLDSERHACRVVDRCVAELIEMYGRKEAQP